jgi:hypothetical protein
MPRPQVGPVPVRPVRNDRRGAWVVAGLVAVLLLVGVGLALSRRGGTDTPKTIPPVSPQLPHRLQGDLQDLVDQVQKR